MIDCLKNCGADPLVRAGPPGPALQGDRQTTVARVDSFDTALSLIEAADRSDGWLAACEERHVYLALNREFVAALVAQVDALRKRAFCPEVLELGASDGQLALALQANGIRVIATDPNPRAETVLPLTAAQALRQFKPCSVLTCFPPVDADIEKAIFDTPSVRNIIYIGPESNGRVGTDAIWNQAGWTVASLPEVDQFIVSRLDYLVDFTRTTHRRRAGALCIERMS